jgi:hypothetical protein
MLKISTIDSPNQRTLVVEGKLISAWTAERRAAHHDAKTQLGTRDLVIDLKNLTVIVRTARTWSPN